MAARPQSERPERFVKEAKALARRVRALRHERGWTLDQAAERTDIDLRHLQKVESGTLNVTLVTLVRLADGFGIAVWALFLDPSDPGVASGGEERG